MQSYASLGNARHAENLMRYMHDLGSQGQEHLLPSRATYNIVLKALNFSNDEGRSERAEKLLREMYDLHEQGDYPKSIKPDTVRRHKGYIQ